MSNDHPNGPPEQDPSLVDLIGVLVEDGRTLFEAETGYWRAALAVVLGGAKRIALLLVLALFFVFFALMALVVGLLIALGSLVGPWLATALVTLALAALAWGSALAAIRRGRRIAALLGGRDA